MSSLVFPSLPGCDIAVTRTPVYATSVTESLSGKELRSTWQTYPRYRYSLTFNFLRSATQAEFQKLFGFIARHAGAFDSFLFQDPEDNAVTAHAFGKGNGTATAFQLQRTLVADADLAAPSSRSYWPNFGDGYEPVWDPVTTTDQEFVNGTPTSVTHGANGLVTFASPPVAGAILTWTGSYYRRVRFADDALGADRIVSQVWKTGALNLISVKP